MDFYCEGGNWDERHNHHAQNCSSAEANRRKRDAWQSAGTKYWWYWACQPTDPWLNPSFIEFPAIHARLFFWLMVRENGTFPSTSPTWYLVLMNNDHLPRRIRENKT
eukprot:COSAG06_NODE_11771_length_1467_cov_1.326754_2_plen_107_part_00